mgnify:FL=1
MIRSSKKIILGSNSPRRRELLAGLDFPFTVDTGNSFQETMDPDVDPRDIPAMMSKGKSYGFHRELAEDEILITSDTVVLVKEGEGFIVLGKPHDGKDAVRMLKSLSGRKHEVLTAVTIRSNSREKTFTDSAKVTFEELNEDEINYYIDNYRPFDKAGAYGIQEWIGYAAISGLEGSFYTVMGFPVHRVYKELKEFL